MIELRKKEKRKKKKKDIVFQNFILNIEHTVTIKIFLKCPLSKSLLGYLLNSVYLTAHLYIFMTYLKEIKVEAKSTLMKLTSVREGHVVGYGLMERGSRPDGNLLRVQARPWAVGKTWHVVTCEVFVMH